MPKKLIAKANTKGGYDSSTWNVYAEGEKLLVRKAVGDQGYKPLDRLAEEARSSIFHCIAREAYGAWVHQRLRSEAEEATREAIREGGGSVIYRDYFFPFEELEDGTYKYAIGEDVRPRGSKYGALPATPQNILKHGHSAKDLPEAIAARVIRSFPYPWEDVEGREHLFKEFCASIETPLAIQIGRHPRLLPGRPKISNLEIIHTVLRTQSAGKAAEELGLDRRTIYRRLSEFGGIASLDRPIAWLPASAAKIVDSMGAQDLFRLADAIVELDRANRR